MRIKLLIKDFVSDLFFPFCRLNEALNRIGSLRILVYHSVADPSDNDWMGLRIGPADFKKQMQLLKDWGYDVLDIKDVFDNGILPNRKAVILTFDDGYNDFIINVLPILEEFRYPATIFVTIEYLKGEREGIVNYWDDWDKMNWRDIKSINVNKRITIASHGFSHNRLNRFKYEKLFKEIVDSKKILECELGKKIDFFAYPHGVYCKECFKLLEEAGYKAAFIGRPGKIEYLKNVYKIKRTEISRYDSSPFDFRKKINGSYDWLGLL